MVENPRRGQAAPLNVRLLALVGRAEPAERDVRPGGARPAPGPAVALAQTRRGRLGSVDLRTGTAALARIWPSLAWGWRLQPGRAAAVFAWLERSRAQAFLVRPARVRRRPHMELGVLAEP